MRQRSRGKVWRWVVALLWAATSHAASDVPLEYQVKASYLYNFMQFIDWPEDVFARGTFNLCVLGADRFGPALDLLAGERVADHEIAIYRLERPENPRTLRCHLVFVSRGSLPAAELLPAIAGRGVLTVGETGGFAEAGGIIELVETRGRIRFEINREAARRAELQMSSRLLELAANVR